MRGVILAGGSGTRLRPATLALNKHLVPVFDKPMIYYPLTTLILMGITELTIVCNPGDQELFKRVFSSGDNFGLEIDFVHQQRPLGLSDALLSACKAHPHQQMVVILGDNIFHGKGLGRELASQLPSIGARAFCYEVADPEHYGVVRMNGAHGPSEIIEKPRDFVSNLAVTGLYFFDETAEERIRDMKPSDRGELEITSLLNSYLAEGLLDVATLPRGTVWIDVGNHLNLLHAANYIQFLQDRTGNQIGNPSDAAAAMNIV